MRGYVYKVDCRLGKRTIIPESQRIGIRNGCKIYILVGMEISLPINVTMYYFSVYENSVTGKM